MFSELELFNAFSGDFLQSPDQIPFSYCINGAYRKGFENCNNIMVSKMASNTHICRSCATGYDIEAGLQVSVEYCEYRNFPVCEWTVYFECIAEKSRRISQVLGMDGIVPQSAKILWSCNGEICSAQSYTPNYTTFQEKLTYFPIGGRSCEAAFPYYRFLGENDGFIYAIGWPGTWQATFTPDKNGVGIACGQKVLDTYLKKGEKLRTPSNTLLFFIGDEEAGINLWRRWFNAHILPKDYLGNIKPRIGRNYNGGGEEFTKANEENQLVNFEKLMKAPAHPDVWWVDAGWYDCKNAAGENIWQMTGTWKPDPKRFPNGFGELGKCCEQAGVELLLWFEPERVRRGTELYLEHPKWLVEYPDAPKHGTAEENFLLDIGEPACMEWLKERISGIIKESKIQIYRQDFNFQPEGYWRIKEGEFRKGFIENRYIQALLEFWDFLLESFPKLHIDAVAAGGRRFDLEVARRALPLHPTDYGYGEHPTKLAFHQILSEWFPYYRSSVLNWEDGDGYKRGGGKPELSSFVVNCCIAPMIQLEHIDYKETSGYEKTAVNIFYEAADYIVKGDYYKLSEYSRADNIWFARQFHLPEEGKGIIQVIRLRKCEMDTYVLLPKAIDEKKEYELKDIESGIKTKISGKELARGLEIKLPIRQAKIFSYQLT